jgi:Family of unknown function (DUF6644)
MQAFAQWLADGAMSQWLQRALWPIILLQTLHILAIAMVLSSVAMVELRVLGLASSAQTMTQTAQRFLPWIWSGLGVLAASGIVLVIAEPKRTLDNNPAFQIKMLMLAIAIAMTVAFQVSLRRNAGRWDSKAPGGKTIGALAVLTLMLWLAIAVAGRWIAYVREG